MSDAKTVSKIVVGRAVAAVDVHNGESTGDDAIAKDRGIQTDKEAVWIGVNARVECEVNTRQKNAVKEPTAVL